MNLESGPAHTWHPIGQLTVRALLRPASRTEHQHLTSWIYAYDFEILSLQPVLPALAAKLAYWLLLLVTLGAEALIN